MGRVIIVTLLWSLERGYDKEPFIITSATGCIGRGIISVAINRSALLISHLLGEEAELKMSPVS